MEREGESQNGRSKRGKRKLSGKCLGKEGRKLDLEKSHTNTEAHMDKGKEWDKCFSGLFDDRSGNCCDQMSQGCPSESSSCVYM